MTRAMTSQRLVILPIFISPIPGCLITFISNHDDGNQIQVIFIKGEFIPSLPNKYLLVTNHHPIVELISGKYSSFKISPEQDLKESAINDLTKYMV